MYTKKHIKVKSQSYSTFRIPEISMYFDIERFKNILHGKSPKAKFKMEAFDEPRTMKRYWVVKIDTEELKRDLFFDDKIVESLNEYIGEKTEEEEKRLLETKKKLKHYMVNGIKHQELLDEEYSKEYLKDTKEFVKEILEEGALWAKDGDDDMVVCKFSDAEDAILILKHLKDKNFELAREASKLDTCIRECIPDSVWHLFSEKGLY